MKKILIVIMAMLISSPAFGKSVGDIMSDDYGVNPVADGIIEMTGTSPYVEMLNSTDEDTEGGRESSIIFKGNQSGGEETTLAKIQASHDGTSDDEKGDLIFYTNDGNDGSSPTERLKIDSAGALIFNNNNGSADQFKISTSNEQISMYFTSDAADASYNWSYDGSGGADMNISHDGILTLGAGGRVHVVISLGVNASAPIGAEIFTVNGDAYFTADVSALTFTDRTPFYEGDALAEIALINGSNGHIDHASLPNFARKTAVITDSDALFSEMAKVAPEEAFEDYFEEQEVEDLEAPTITGYHIKNGSIFPIDRLQNKIIQTPKKRLKKGIVLNEQTGELFAETQTTEERRDLGAMISILTVGIQQLTIQNTDLLNRIEKLEK